MSHPQPSARFPWLRLLRVANLPSAIANILMGYLLACQTWSPIAPLLFLVGASSAIYLSGMVLNDVFDLEVDRQERPSRPLPSGQISVKTATIVGYGLLVLGIASAGLAVWASDLTGAFQFKPIAIAVFIAICVYLYDGPMKRTIAAPFIMGACRFFNVLLGASLAVSSSLFGFSTEVIWIASVIGMLIAGTTLLGRREAAEEQNLTALKIAGAIILLSLIGLACSAFIPMNELTISQQTKKIFPIFIAMISFPILRRVGEAVLSAKPKKIQVGVVSVLKSLIILDASICYLAAPQHPEYAILVLCLLVPALLLGRFVPST